MAGSLRALPSANSFYSHLSHGKAWDQEGVGKPGTWVLRWSFGASRAASTPVFRPTVQGGYSASLLRQCG